MKKYIESLTKEEIEEYYITHNMKNSALHFNICKQSFAKLLNKFSIPKHSHAEEIRLGCQEKYGVDNAYQLTSSKEKSNTTKLERYGSSTYNNREKALITSTLTYGGGNYNNREKAFLTYRNTHNFDNPFQDLNNLNSHILNKYETLENFYEFRSNLMALSIRNKYNVTNISQLPEVAAKKVRTAKRAVAFDGEIFDSNWEVMVYEFYKRKPVTIERNIIINFDYNNKHKSTFIDFKINDNLYEVKGNHLLDGCFDYESAVPIEIKLNLYRDNNVTVITDTSKLDLEKFKNLNFIDIHNFN